MTETQISIRSYSAEGSLVYYTIQVGEWIYDGHATTLDGAFKLIKHNLGLNGTIVSMRGTTKSRKIKHEDWKNWKK
jgi:hypothetical protein